MTREEFQLLDAIVAKLLELPMDERQAVARELCGDDSELHREVLSLLETEPQGNFLEPGPVAEGRTLQPVSEPGQTLGVWRLERLLGRGGMGSVYLASRADGHFDRKAAVKILDMEGSEASGTFAERFRREGDILARLDHPNIARLLDAGTTPEGRSYFVLEYVAGTSCKDWCRAQNSNLGQKLHLFLKICEAVQFAHGHLIVHRDLKPSNILVDNTGQPHLVDFGIARLLDGAEHNSTRTGFRAFSLNYASPEQILGRPATTADDVYALGVLLYELLTGQPPYRLTSMDLPAILRFASAPDYPPPSAVAPDLGADLDAVVLKAMALDRTVRYATPAELAEDLRRYLNGFPVRALRPGVWYKVRKFGERNSLAVTAATLIAILVVAATGYILGQTRRAQRYAAEATRQRDEAGRQRDEATAQRHVAEQRQQEAVAAAQAEGKARDVAAAERTRAVSRFNDVRSLARFLIFDLEPAAASVPGATPLRKKIADEAVRYLDRLSASLRGEAGDLELWRDISHAYTRLGMVQGDSSNSANLGDREGSLQSFRQAAAAAEQMANLARGAAEPKRRVAEAYVTLASHLRAMRKDAEADTVAEKAGAILDALQMAHADDQELLQARARLAFFRRDYPVYTDLSEQMLRSKPGNGDLMRYAALGHKYLANTGEDKDKVRHAERALELDKMRLEGRPGDPAIRLDLSFDLSTLATLRAISGDRRGAARQFGEMTALRRELRDADPANVRFAERLAAGLCFEGIELLASGDRTAAKKAFEEAQSIARTLAGKTAAGLDRELEAAALAGLADTAGDETAACQYALEALRLAESSKPAPGSDFSQPLGGQMDDLKRKASSCVAGR